MEILKTFGCLSYKEVDKQELEMHNSRLDKEAIIQAAHDEGLPEFFEG